MYLCSIWNDPHIVSGFVAFNGSGSTHGLNTWFTVVQSRHHRTGLLHCNESIDSPTFRANQTWMASYLLSSPLHIVQSITKICSIAGICTMHCTHNRVRSCLLHVRGNKLIMWKRTLSCTMDTTAVCFVRYRP